MYNEETLLNSLRSPLRNERNQALSLLYETHFGSIARFVIDNSGTQEDARDIFQDGLMVLYEKAQNLEFNWTSTMKTFLFAVCRNLWFKRLRKASNREIPTEDFNRLDLEDIAFEDPYESQKFLLGKLMDQVGGSCKEILILFYYQRKSMQEIAGHMNLASEGTAKNKKARCMDKLRELFQQAPDL